jgi:hypothetical protein
MKLAHSLSLALALSTMGAPGWAADADDHQAHHPAGTASAPATKAMPGKGRPDMARMDSQMKAMHEMHDKMMAAKTPAERDALTADHMKIMQDSMTMMNGMSPAGMSGMGVMKGDMGGAPSNDGGAHGNDAGHDADDDGPSARCTGEVTGAPR